MFFFCSRFPGVSIASPAELMEDRHAAQLRDLAEMGMDMARALHAAVMAGEGPPDADLRFARISRAIRQSIALEKRLSDEWAEERADNGAASAAARPHPRNPAGGTGAEREGDDGHAEQIDAYAGFTERLADPAEDEDFLDRPVEEVIAQIRRDLGVAASTPNPSSRKGDPTGRLVRDPAAPTAAASPSSATGMLGPGAGPDGLGRDDGGKVRPGGRGRDDGGGARPPP